MQWILPIRLLFTQQLKFQVNMFPSKHLKELCFIDLEVFPLQISFIMQGVLDSTYPHLMTSGLCQTQKLLLITKRFVIIFPVCQKQHQASQAWKNFIHSSFVNCGNRPWTERQFILKCRTHSVTERTWHAKLNLSGWKELSTIASPSSTSKNNNKKRNFVESYDIVSLSDRIPNDTFSTVQKS